MTTKLLVAWDQYDYGSQGIPVDALERPIAYQRSFRRITKSTVAAVFLSQAWYWTKTLPKDREGWFFKTQAEWEEETGLTRTEQETARRHLRDAELIEEKKEGLPAKLWFRISTPELIGSLRSAYKDAETLQPWMQESRTQERGNPADIHTETTPETTAEITLRARVKNIEDSIHREDFAAVWAIYPKKEAKADAFKAWEQLDPPVSLVAIIQQAVLQQTENNWAGRETRFIPSLGPWLRGRRWEDAIVAPTQTNGTKPRLGKHGQRVYSPDELIERARKEMGG
jgi:hypothetical protein